MKNPNSKAPHPKKIVVNFEGGKLTSDAGALFFKQLDDKLRLSQRINELIADPRDPVFTVHQQREIIAQRIFSIGLGYEDLNDHFTFRKDPALLAAVKGSVDDESPLASSSTLCRFENRVTEKEVSEAQKLFVELFIESFKSPPKIIFLDFDATNDTVHGKQIGECFNGFYDEHCFLPLYVFCGMQLLFARLRSPKTGQAHGTVAVLNFLVKRLRAAFPDVQIVFRGDAGFYGPKLLDYCERNDLKYIVGFSSNPLLKRMASNYVFASEMFFVEGGSSEPFRIFGDLNYRAKTWSSDRRVIVKAERLLDGENKLGKENTRFIVTNLDGTAKELYEDVYCARGDMENRIKEQQLMLFADRTSCHDFTANRFRLLLSSFSYVLMETMRRTALYGTELAKAQCSTIRLKLFKVAALVKESVRRIVFSLPDAYPFRELWLTVSERLGAISRESG